MLEPFYSIPSDAEIERERERRDAAEKAGAAAPIPLPSSMAALLAVAERYRRSTLDALARGYNFVPNTADNFAAIVTGQQLSGVLMPSVGRLYDAAAALDVGAPPPLPSEPTNGRDAVAALDSLIEWCRLKAESAPPTTKDKLKEPSKDAFACYRLSCTLGGKQSVLADMMARELGKPVDQSKVSRWLTQVRSWIKAGNILPDLTPQDSADGAPRPKIKYVDPAKLDRQRRASRRDDD